MGDTSSSLRRLAEIAGTRPESAEVDLATERLLAWTVRDITPDEETLTLLDRLRADGWLLGLVTDCEAQVAAVWETTALRTRLHGVTFSCSTGRRKPAAEQYRHCSRQMGVKIQDCVFVGDGGGDELNGALGVGAAAIHLCRAGFNPTVPAGRWPGPCADRLSILRHMLAGAQHHGTEADRT
jgi:putative hydrolase of the HAD superfamily